MLVVSRLESDLTLDRAPILSRPRIRRCMGSTRKFESRQYTAVEPNWNFCLESFSRALFP